MSELGLTGKRAVITGAAGGLGRAFAQGFAQAGARVVVADINPDGIAETAQMVRDLGGEAEPITVDVTSTASCTALAKAAKAAFGGVDILINNAAIYAGLERRRFEEIDEAVFDKVMAVNVKGVWQMSRALTPLMREAGGGAILNLASATVFSGSPMWMHYVALGRRHRHDPPDGARVGRRRHPGERDRSRLHPDRGQPRSDGRRCLYGVSRGASSASEPADMVGGALPAQPFRLCHRPDLVIDGGRQFI